MATTDYMETFYASHKMMLLKYANKLTHDPDLSEDIFTDSHLSVSEEYHNLTEVEYRKLMYTCIHNRWLWNKRKTKAQAKNLPLWEELSIEDQMLKNQELALLDNCLSALSPKERQLILVRARNQSGAYRSKVKRAKIKLKKMIKEMN